MPTLSPQQFSQQGGKVNTLSNSDFAKLGGKVNQFPKQEPHSVTQSFHDTLTQNYDTQKYGVAPKVAGAVGIAPLGEGLASARMNATGEGDTAGNLIGADLADTVKVNTKIHELNAQLQAKVLSPENRSNLERQRDNLVRITRQHAGMPDITQGQIDQGTNLSDKQVVGAALNTVGLVAGGAGASEAAGGGTLLESVAGGASGGMIGGTLSGAGNELVNNPNANLKSTVRSAAKGGVEGAVIGGVAGGVTHGLGAAYSKVFPSATQAEAKTAESTWNMIKPELTKTEQAAAVKEGKIVTKGVLGTVKQVPKGQDLAMIEAAKPYVTGAKNEIEAVANMQQGITEEANKLRNGLKQSTATWSTNNLKGALSKAINSSDNLVGDSAAAFKKTTDAVLQEAGKADKNLSGLLDVRQAFDSRVASQYPNLYDSSNSAIKVAVTKTRNAINQMIEDALPEGKTLDGISFRDSLKKQSLLYNAIDNTASKTPKVGSNVLTRFAKNNPTKAKIAKGAALVGGGALLGGKIVGAAKSLVGQ